MARNYRIGRLEADIIAADGGILVLVEVRGRVGRQFRPSRSLSAAKLRNLTSLAGMLQRKWKRRIRIELFEVLADGEEGQYGLERFVICGPTSA